MEELLADIFEIASILLEGLEVSSSNAREDITGLSQRVHNFSG